MLLFVTVLHVILSLLLILVIIVQPGKGADIGSAFGGGASSTVFGPRGPGSLLARATTVIAVLFMVTSITLAVYSDQQIGGGGGIDEDLLEGGSEAEEFGAELTLPTTGGEEAAPPTPEQGTPAPEAGGAGTPEDPPASGGDQGVDGDGPSE